MIFPDVSYVSRSHGFVIVNAKTEVVLETWNTARSAKEFCGAVNDHEERCGRGRVFEVRTAQGEPVPVS